MAIELAPEKEEKKAVPGKFIILAIAVPVAALVLGLVAANLFGRDSESGQITEGAVGEQPAVAVDPSAPGPSVENGVEYLQ